MSQPIGMSGLARNTPARLAAFPSVSSQSKVVLFDDFLGAALGSGWAYTEGTDGATAGAAIVANAAGGVLQLTTGDTGTGLAADMAQLNYALQALPSNGGLEAVAKLSLSQITEAYMFFGFTDTVALEGPVVSAGSANDITTNASNAVGFMFDTRMTADNFWLVGVEGDTDAQAQNSLVAPAAGVEVELRIKVAADGSASFFIDGVGVGTVMANAVAPAAPLTLTMAVSKVSGATSMTLDSDYAGWAMTR